MGKASRAKRELRNLIESGEITREEIRETKAMRRERNNEKKNIPFVPVLFTDGWRWLTTAEHAACKRGKYPQWIKWQKALIVS